MLNRVTTPLALRLLERDSEQFDQRYGVRTAAWSTLDELTVEDGSVDEGLPYVPTPPRLLRALLATSIGSPRGWTFVDYGSGRGRALLVAALYGFPRVIGVEFAHELHDAAERNVRSAAERVRRARRIELVLGDAAEFELPSGPLALFFNNPFTGDVFEAVAENIEASYRDEPRPIVVMYQTMKDEDAGQSGAGNLARLDGSTVLRKRPVRPRSPMDLLALRPFLLGSWATAEACHGLADGRGTSMRTVPVPATD